MSFKMVQTGNPHDVIFKNNFIIPEVWDEASKMAYAKWFASLPEGHIHGPAPWVKNSTLTVIK